MPEWVTVSAQPKTFLIDRANADTRAPLQSYLRTRTTKTMPLIKIDTPVAKRLSNPEHEPAFLAIFNDTIASLAKLDVVTGACIDVSELSRDDVARLTRLFIPLSQATHRSDLTSCVVLSSQADDQSLRLAGAHMDLVVVKIFIEPWVGSAPQPTASIAWFQQQIRHVQTFIPKEKLVAGIGTFTTNWTSGRPKPQILPYAEAMTQLSQAGATPRFDAQNGNSQASFLNPRGLQNRMWMLDAASAHNQLRYLQDAGIEKVSIWRLGMEDPGLWPVLDYALNASSLSPTPGLRNVVLDSYVQQIGQGPFVSPLSMPRIGHRNIKTDVVSGLIRDMKYSRIPSASIVKLYGQGQPNQVVLTFDDGPHPVYTKQTLDILKDKNTPATFFVLGHNAINAPDLMRQILADGHEIGSHTY